MLRILLALMIRDADVQALVDRVSALITDEPVSCVCVDTDKCGQSKAATIRDLAPALQSPDVPAQLDALVDLASAVFKTFPHKRVPVCWRSVHTDASILRTACDWVGGTSAWEQTVRRLDLAIIISGAAGYGRLDLLHDFIEAIQTKHLPLLDDPFANEPNLTPSSASVQLPAHARAVPRLSSPPSLAEFTKTLSSSPFILPGFVSDWPALNEHPWSSRSYLLRAAGLGRVVPVELGADYTKEDWGQELVPWEAVLRDMLDARRVRYLAQHDLLTQFPALRADIVVPDYVYADVPGARDTLLFNAWLGCRGAGSPAHTDAFANCYCVVTGRRSVWLAPPNVEGMDPAGNTARVDVFAADGVLPHSVAALLEPGDVLYIPRGWWHAFRIEDPSFAVSMWF